MNPLLKVAQPLTLPSGAVIRNRFLKSAMSEAMADRSNSPNRLHVELYRKWAEGGTGIVVTGNVMVDRGALGEPGNVVVEDRRDMDGLKRWAQAGTRGGAHLWMQINHPGKQSPRTMSKQPVAPSAVPIGGSYGRAFNTPRELTNAEVKGIVKRFAETARIAQEAGFTGVQIHGAHGYLVNQFLSPADNRRNDEYGGSAENRMRFLIEIYDEMRRVLGAGFPIGLKLNSADFKEGGFTEQDSEEVVKAMAERGIDLIEISGGNYENPKMSAEDDGEVFFLKYAERMASIVHVPIAVTGGFRSKLGMEEALAAGKTSMIGIARPLALIPDIPNQIMEGRYETVTTQRLTTGFPSLDRQFGAMIGLSYYEQQMRRIAQGKAVKLHRNAWDPLLHMVRRQGIAALSPRRSN
ncbi:MULTISPECIES: NADH:flavin oxidoreductase/NADH oxidase family protein [Saccharibacillus]|uniref:NADH:flavin oxidoreductase/NADH oxidase family protein n=1 Tax=Saccharibacillus brassicae TaxID=2583377 RepID=A0A4Y6UVT0_SACBS|nr:MULTISPECIES: NADH:flavin oxidoreductase/NADH oxidase family protein [Saccharibacillus]MWJ29583.1 NADH oxidase [Saccharibacillus sp. WB 17]QDH21823.1 NADH:flavin oxidoreductase/NADH oxidase family protein [Saccharibacillus brassicae]